MPPPHDLASLRRALRVHGQWLATWQRTGDLRHLRTAQACQAIVTERLAAVAASQALRRVAFSLTGLNSSSGD